MNTERMPIVPDLDPCDCRAQSAPVLIQTRDGGWYTARWTVYQGTDFAPVWELIGRDGLQLEREEVVAWFYCGAVAELIADMRTIAELDPEQAPSGNNEWGEAECFGVAARIARAALARVGGAP